MVDGAAHEMEQTALGSFAVGCAVSGAGFFVHEVLGGSLLVFSAGLAIIALSIIFAAISVVVRLD